MKVLETENDLYGPEQVSAHYEHFSFARRHALIFWGGFFVIRFVARTDDLYMFGKTALKAWIFLFSYLYFFTEGKKYFMMPMLNRFYRKIASMEMMNLDTYYNENIEVRVRNLMSIAKSQIEYKLIHNDYMSIRNNLILNYLINEQISLKNHISDRTQNILKQAEQIEEFNKNKIISAVMEETFKSIDRAY
eukprot:GHVR01006371.1.p1 GENE.GHVR01006371.1~~GHVR01006371.1.p1  ORF type:complete len:191 (+),score=4.30 GHVR01006371.1:146-718(+)